MTDADGAGGEPDYVVLLHGLGRTRLSMTVPELRLRAAGYEPVAVQYPSRSRPVAELAAYVGAELERRIVEPTRRVHFLTHSLGGIVVRAMLGAGEPPFRLGHVVMLAPPNQGSRLAERFGDHLWFRAATGPAGQELRAGEASVPRGLGPVEYAVGVIAGNRAGSPWAFLVRDGQSDGTVTIDETELEGMADFLVVPRGHTFIMNDPAVIDQAIEFFRRGRFARDTR